ncbi:peptide deformylase [Candidatus Thermokryptus mobilis]|uniref:Peptide deformylase n=1 Tax=Candidatus Thermokryptus mobilis TaxID=1643428 RepID=A0A0S4N5Q4_9BACT|nr:peptide deformylase [Candidatus Thermokryptus mobilis]CUU05345.1 peptide deformylase [Candidatus Thermokryptus mobilis]
MILPIYLYGDPIFKKPAQKVKWVDEKFIDTLKDMFETMTVADGIGLAATQVGIPFSFAVIDVSVYEEYKDFKRMVIINPEIVHSDGEDVMEEGCLSIPGIRAEIIRPAKVVLRYQDIDMKVNEIECEGLLARVVQHEVDHLYGKFFIDYLSPVRLKTLKPKLTKIRRGNVKAHYPVVVPGTKKVIFPEVEATSRRQSSD